MRVLQIKVQVDNFLNSKSVAHMKIDIWVVDTEFRKVVTTQNYLYMYL
jgi:hypothetical protein